MVNGAILWQGKSRIDGERIVAVITGLRRPSANPKTGAMAQVWILRADQHPSAAIRSGADASICGACPLRGSFERGRLCYVNPMASLVAGLRWTGYTHQWRTRGASSYRGLVMASVESSADAEEARALGWRTFRVRTESAPLASGEIACPASAESGFLTTCERCGLCAGSAGADDARKSIAIIAHGVNSALFAGRFGEGHHG